MCLVAFALSVDPSVPLWLASNRDERWDRPTTPLHRWTLPNGVSVIGGRDEQDGGTWLAASEHGRIAWLTNVREAERPAAERSRGGLVTDWLASEEPWERWHLRHDPRAFGGFNLVWVTNAKALGPGSATATLRACTTTPIPNGTAMPSTLGCTACPTPA